MSDPSEREALAPAGGDEAIGDPDAGDEDLAPGMSEEDARSAERLAVDLERVLGVGVAVADLETTGDGPVSIRAALLVDGMIREIQAAGETRQAAYAALVRSAAELRLDAAWWRIVGPT